MRVRALRWVPVLVRALVLAREWGPVLERVLERVLVPVPVPVPVWTPRVTAQTLRALEQAL